MPHMFPLKVFANLASLTVALALFVLLTKTAHAATQPAAPHLKVMASIAPVYGLAASVMQGAGTPRLLVRPNQSPHDYVMRPSDARHLSEAQVMFWIGEELEAFLERPLKNIASQAAHVRLLDTPGLTVLPAQDHHDHQADQIDIAEHIEAIDPHIWLDADNAIAITRTMAETFSALDPSRAALYTQNAQNLIEKLVKVDTRLSKQLAPLHNRPYFTFHSAYQYFEHRYGLHAQDIVNLRPDLSIGPKALATLRAKALALPKFCVFLEPEFDQQTTRKYFVGTPAIFDQLDPLGANLEGAENFFPDLLEKMGASMQDCLSPLAATSPRS